MMSIHKMYFFNKSNDLLSIFLAYYFIQNSQSHTSTPTSQYTPYTLTNFTSMYLFLYETQNKIGKDFICNIQTLFTTLIKSNIIIGKTKHKSL